MRSLWQYFNRYLENKIFIVLLILVNLAGSIYGFIWYKNQLLITPMKWLIFVPDSPMSSALFTVFLVFFLFKIRFSFLEALAAITMFKYGIWATAIIIWGAWMYQPSFTSLIMVESISWIEVMLITSHLAMAIEAVIFFKKYSFGFISVFFAGLWIFVNDYIDYTRDIHPWLPGTLQKMDTTVGLYTLYLSGFTLVLFYFLSILRRKNE